MKDQSGWGGGLSSSLRFQQLLGWQYGRCANRGVQKRPHQGRLLTSLRLFSSPTRLRRNLQSVPLCTFVSFVIDEVQMLEAQRTRRYTKDKARVFLGPTKPAQSKQE